MAKYSTGGSDADSDGTACELCGETSDSLEEATVAGATLLVCQSCAPHDDSPQQASSEQSTDRDRPDRTAEHLSETSELWDGDSSRWEQEGADYDTDQLPYLVSGYDELVTTARQDKGYTQTELAEQAGISQDDLLAVEQGRAARAGVGGSVIEALEQQLEIQLSEQTD